MPSHAASLAPHHPTLLRPERGRVPGQTVGRHPPPRAQQRPLSSQPTNPTAFQAAWGSRGTAPQARVGDMTERPGFLAQMWCVSRGSGDARVCCHRKENAGHKPAPRLEAPAPEHGGLRVPVDLEEGTSQPLGSSIRVPMLISRHPPGLPGTHPGPSLPMLPRLSLSVFCKNLHQSQWVGHWPMRQQPARTRGWWCVKAGRAALVQSLPRVSAQGPRAAVPTSRALGGLR